MEDEEYYSVNHREGTEYKAVEYKSEGDCLAAIDKHRIFGWKENYINYHSESVNTSYWRDMSMPNYSEIVALESEYDALVKKVAFIRGTCIILIFCGIFMLFISSYGLGILLIAVGIGMFIFFKGIPEKMATIIEQAKFLLVEEREGGEDDDCGEAEKENEEASKEIPKSNLSKIQKPSKNEEKKADDWLL